MFCPKCGSLMMPKTIGDKKVVSCSCGHQDGNTNVLSIKETSVKKGRELEVVEEDADQIHPLTEEECPKCRHGKAFFWLTQTRAGDEPETRFFRCEKCKHTWREYS